jgi:hypothetical protein
MQPPRTTLAPGIPSLASLGVADAGALMQPDSSPSERGQVLERDGGFTRLRYPLPGTPAGQDEEGRPKRGKPMGAGTGWVDLLRWTHAPLVSSLGARLQAPRSGSLAERWWNLACRLLEAGVATPEPLAVVARGDGLVARDSYVIVRAPTGFLPLPDWLGTVHEPRDRRRGLQALGRLLARLLRSGVELPELSARDVSMALLPAGCCGDEEETPPGNRMPSVLLTSLAGGRLHAQSTTASARLLARLAAEVDATTTRGERARVLALALHGCPDRSARAALLRRLAP